MRVPILCTVLLLSSQLFAVASKPVNFLTFENALHRSDAVTNIRYKLHIHLTSDNSEYQGEANLRFNLKDTQNIFLDFSDQEGAKISEIQINKKRSAYRWEEGKIYLASENLKLKENEVRILFSNSFSNKGKGLHRFVDREDKEVYIYSNLEPYYANEIFPHFDQPDLKASYELSVSAPKHWQVIANTLETEKKRKGENFTLWKFKETQNFSSYLFAMIAGPFAKWESKSSSGIPLRIFARKTLAKYINTTDWFAMTEHSFAFMEKEFNYPYPFNKYDQILVPEFSAGAMENVGAVTFNEDLFIQRGTPTPLDRLQTMEVLAHEMSHMWFGNLVTMKWWDDLWLNESFATFISYLTAEANSKELNLLDPWLSFNANAKFAAYLEDGYRSTTHPIVGTVRNTDEAMSTFDSITYRKGASVLKQLYFYVGKEAFYKGVRSYFKKHAFGNTTRHDFLQSLSEASGLDLKSWDNEWLRSRGTNRIQVEIKTDENKIQRLLIKQFPDPMDHLLRTHRTIVGLYKYDKHGALTLFKSIPVTYQGAETEIKEAVGLESPALVFPNVSDFDLVNITLDAKSLETAYKSLSHIDDSLLRQQLYMTLWYMLRDAEISAKEFVVLATKHAANETDITVLNDVLDNLRIAITYVAKNSRVASNALVSDFLWERLEKAEPNSALQTLLFDHFLVFATAKHGKRLESWLEGKQTLAGLLIDQDRRWNILGSLAAMQYPQASKLIKKEKKRDTSSRGLVKSMVAEVRSPVLSVKKKWYAKLSTPGKMVATDARAVMGAFQNILAEDLTGFVSKDYFSSILKQIAAKEFDSKVAHFAAAMYPITYPQTFEVELAKFVKEHPELPSVVRKAMLKRAEDSEKIRTARLKFQ